MLPNDPIVAITPEVIGWRHVIHANPELGISGNGNRAFRRRAAAEFSASRCTRGSAAPASSAYCARRRRPRPIGLRAELDALPIRSEPASRTRREIPA